MKYKYSIIFLVVCAVLLAMLLKMYRKDVSQVGNLPIVEDSAPSPKADVVPVPAPIVVEEEILYDASASLDGNKITYTRNGTTVEFTKPSGWEFTAIEPDSLFGNLDSKIDTGRTSEPYPEKIYYRIIYGITDAIDAENLINDEYNQGGFQEETLTLANGTDVKLFSSPTVPGFFGEYVYLIQIPGETQYFELTLRPYYDKEPYENQEEAAEIFKDILPTIDIK